jgi:hypothetical protein
MRARMPALAAVLAFVALSMAGCGDRNLIVNVDVLSYLDPSVTQVAFGPYPAAPGGIATGEVAVVQDVSVNLFERPNDLAKVQSVSLSFAAEVRDSTGSGSDTLRLYMSDANTNPMTTTPIVTLPVVLVAGQIDTVRVNVTGDQRLVDLFDGNSVRVTVTNALRGPSSGPALNGRLQFIEIRAVLVAGRKGL